MRPGITTHTNPSYDRPATSTSCIALVSVVLFFVAFAPVASADEIQVIFSEVTGDPTAVVPGAVDLGGNPIVTEFKAIEDFFLSPDGSQWVLKGRNHGGSDIETMMLSGAGTSGAVFAQEGQPVHGGVAGEVYDFFDGVGSFNDTNQFAYGARARGGSSTVKEKVILYDGSIYTIVAQESDAALGLLDLAPAPSGDELFGNSLNSIHLLNDGRVGFVAVTIQNVHSSRRPAIFYDNQSFAQSGVTPIASDTWDSFDSNDFHTTPDGASWFAQGDDEGSTATDDILVVNGTVVIREGSTLPGSSITVDGIFHTYMAANGDWFSRGDDAADDDWAVHSGTVVASTGTPITPGSPENWGASFLAFNGNSSDDWILIGTTDSADPAADTVMVLNGRDVVVREGDPVDLDGNGIADDDAFIGRGDNTLSAFAPNDARITEDGVVYFIAPLRDAAGNDLGTFGSGGEAFLRLSLPPTCGSGNVDLSNGTPQDVLLINASAAGPSRSTTIATGEGFSLALDAAQGGPASGRFVVWAWIGAGQAPTDLTAQSALVGCTVNPTPLSLSLSPQPKYCLPGQGIPAFACTGTNVKNVANFAPWSVTRPSGIGVPLTLTLQGLLQDDSTGHPSGYSVTNAVTLHVQ